MSGETQKYISTHIEGQNSTSPLLCPVRFGGFGMDWRLGWDGLSN